MTIPVQFLPLVNRTPISNVLNVLLYDSGQTRPSSMFADPANVYAYLYHIRQYVRIQREHGVVLSRSGCSGCNDREGIGGEMT